MHKLAAAFDEKKNKMLLRIKFGASTYLFIK